MSRRQGGGGGGVGEERKVLFIEKTAPASPLDQTSE
jgi:hypothetical protein